MLARENLDGPQVGTIGEHSRRIAERDTRDWRERRDTRNQGARRACRARRARRARERLEDFFSILLVGRHVPLGVNHP